MIARHAISVTVAGSAGSATGSGTSTQPINGRLLAVYIDYTSQPVTADVTITSTVPTQTLLTRSNSGTDGWFYPRALLQDTAAANLTAVYDAMPICGYVNVAVAQGDAGSVDVILMVEND